MWWVASSWWRRCPVCKDWTLRHPHFGHPHFGEHHFLGILTLGNTRWENRIVDLAHTDRSYCHLSFLKPTHSSYSKPISTKNTCLQNIFCLSFLGKTSENHNLYHAPLLSKIWDLNDRKKLWTIPLTHLKLCPCNGTNITHDGIHTIKQALLAISVHFHTMSNSYLCCCIMHTKLIALPNSLSDNLHWNVGDILCCAHLDTGAVSKHEDEPSRLDILSNQSLAIPLLKLCPNFSQYSFGNYEYHIMQCIALTHIFEADLQIIKILLKEVGVEVIFVAGVLPQTLPHPDRSEVASKS